MLRIYECKNIEQAKSYYTQGLSRDDYYNKGREIPGVWRGEGAKLLGLTGDVQQRAFNALCDNRNPQTSDQLTPRMSDKRRVGYDINFNAPKSLSLLNALGNDQEILEAFQKSVQETMLQIERDMQTRVRVGGKSEDRKTSNMVWGEFTHLTARPVEGHPDPHLHCHCFAFNTTFDQEEDRWKAGQFGSIKRDAPYYEALFHSKLSERVQELGYGVSRTSKGWEVSGIPQSLLEEFSRRSEQIEKIAKESGVTSKKSKDQLGARTREKKQPELSSEELLEDWKERAGEEGLQTLEEVLQNKGRSLPSKTTEKEVVDQAIHHHFERVSVIEYRRLMADAMKLGYGSVSAEAIQEEFKKRDFIAREEKGQTLVTTREVFEEEVRMVDEVRESRGTCVQLNQYYTTYHDEKLSEEQQNAVRHVLDSQDRVMGIRGAAGTGKTTLMKEAVRGIEEGGKKVLLFAPTSDASRIVLRKEGFKDADTVSQLLSSSSIYEAAKDQVIWIDEAGLLSSKTMKEVLDLSKEVNARVILSGDSRQHKSVERGDSLRLLEEHAGFTCAELTTIYRQSGTYRDAVKELSHQNIAKGIEILDQLGAIKEMEGDERYLATAQKYADFRKSGKTALVVSPTRKEGKMISGLIRHELREAGIIEPEESEKHFPTLRNINLTESQKSDCANYEAGQVVQFMKHFIGIQKGEKLTVLGVQQGTEKDLVLVENWKGKKFPLPLHEPDRFQVYEQGAIAIAPGEQIRFTQGGMSADGHRLHNGTVHRVEGFLKNGNIRLENGWEIRRKFCHLDHGYVSTSHSSQGKTVDHVIISQGSESFGRASSMEQFYVSASRGRESITIFTDDREGLKESVSVSSSRLSALELKDKETLSTELKDYARELIRKQKYDKIIRSRGSVSAETLAGVEISNQNKEQDKPPTLQLPKVDLNFSASQTPTVNVPANSDQIKLTPPNFQANEKPPGKSSNPDIKRVLGRYFKGTEKQDGKPKELTAKSRQVLNRYGIKTKIDLSPQHLKDKDREHGN